ncbi:MAG TPA: hypothetical protein VD927_09625 [Chryseosolibacter sp.]|nr:hypothetical protein [Chryseosolibacter sp.]
MKFFALMFFQVAAVIVAAQGRKQFIRPLQFSITPGISTNGIHPGGYSNYISLNLTSGYSAANYLLEIAGISNLNVIETRGLQFAGIANMTGANAFAGLYEKEIVKKEKEGFEANLSGLQIAGVTNVVLDNVFGAQVSGGINGSGGALQGVQLAGLVNVVRKYSFGIQFAGVGNVSVESMDGVQFAGVFNITEGGLFGLQVSMINKAGFIEGINSFNNTNPTGVQIGLVNHAKIMNGFQIGILNIGRRMQGTQVGLINIFKDGKTLETRGGTSIGLINVGATGYLSVYANELFNFNVEVATGNIKNVRMKNDAVEMQLQNGLIYAKNFGSTKNSEQWAVGYGFKKFFFNRSASPGYSKLRLLAIGFDLLHINHDEGKFTRDLSLITRPQVMAGSRFHPKNRAFYFFAAASYNVYFTDTDEYIEGFIREGTTASGKRDHWPGLSLGVLIQ